MPRAEAAGHAFVALDGEVRDDLPGANLRGKPQHLEPVAPVELEDLVNHSTIGTAGHPVLVTRGHPPVRALRPSADAATDPPDGWDRTLGNRFGNTRAEAVRADGQRSFIHSVHCMHGWTRRRRATAATGAVRRSGAGAHARCRPAGRSTKNAKASRAGRPSGRVPVGAAARPGGRPAGTGGAR